VPSFTFAKSGPLYPAITLLWFSLRGLWDPDVPLRELGQKGDELHAPFRCDSEGGRKHGRDTSGMHTGKEIRQ